MHVYREPPLHDAMQIRDPPAHHLVRGHIGSVLYQLAQLGHLRLCHIGRSAWILLAFQRVDAALVVTVDPIPQRLSVHAIAGGSLGAWRAFQHHGKGRRRRTCAPSRHLAASARSSPLVCSVRVIIIGLPTRCLHPANRSTGGIESEISEEENPPLARKRVPRESASTRTGIRSCRRG
jgi:hypothetical protein